MIVDKFENLTLYRNLSSGIKKGFEFLEKTDLNIIEAGKYDICEGVFAIVSEYDSKAAAECKPEAHHKYIDIQYIIKGEELIGYAPLNNQEIMIPYDEEKDLIFYTAECNYSKLTKGMFAIYFPSDIHQPGVMVNEPTAIKKVVVKIAV